MVKQYALAAGLFLFAVVLVAPGLPSDDQIVAPPRDDESPVVQMGPSPQQVERVFDTGPVAYEPPAQPYQSVEPDMPVARPSVPDAGQTRGPVIMDAPAPVLPGATANDFE